jgi:hypothetical protein
MNIKLKGTGAFLGMAIAMGSLGLSALAAECPPSIVGNCAEFECSELLTELNESFPDEIDQALSRCTENHFMRMTVGGPDESRYVSLTCWEEKKDLAGYREGYFLGWFPFPGDEESFGSSWGCYNPTCEAQISALKETYPEEMRNHERQCGIIGGELQIFPIEAQQKLDILCVFSAGVILVDLDDDGISDGENSRGAFADYNLGSYPLP